MHDLTNVFGKDNLIVRLFDKNEFKDGDLLKDFVDAIGLGWDENFIIPENQNEALDLLGMKLQHSLNKIFRGWMEPNRVLMRGLSQKHFSSNDKELKFSPPKEILQSYIDYFEESNEWVRKEFFPHKERLFTKKDLTNYKENYELKEMKPEYWDRIAAFIADIVKTKNQAITNKDNLIKQKDTQLQTLQSKINTLTHQNTQLNNTINSIPHKKANLELESLQLDIANKKLNLKKQEKELGIKLSKLEPKIILNLINPNSATQRIKNQLSYKLGVALINNSKSLLGYIRMPYVLSYIKETHQKEQELYKQSITQNPNLKLPPLESYPDYEEAIKIKNHLTYKLGEALIKANNVREGGKNTLLYPLLKRSA
ncbi:hypothetical protein [Helicobacter burdigaliensis]|uniref:hypothetical protein n=1 Tax=Helicobacter burdigaliensis TaxID=2315334 RepID=UPI001300AC66|nr:hypothetical protein [Helicobacter burdigaliensis]